uniref:Exocyst complex component n=1 Tax=Neogobius melanostomus TaxID=47308 RepID=A0A8C6T930_9GOBI
MASVEAAAEHERILREIESTDTNCIGPTLRSVYDGQEHGFFMEKLDARIRNHDREIEKMCNHHFQGFVDSITELLKVRGEALKLKVRDRAVNAHTITQCRIQQRNIASTIDKLTHCLPGQRTKLSAGADLPARAGQYRFCAIMTQNIPKLRDQIRDTAMAQLRDFLESIRKHSDKIGETAMRQVQQGRRETGTAGGAVRQVQQGAPTFSIKASWKNCDENEEQNKVPGAQELVDFSPVYRCFHIYTVLGLHDEFENYYRKQRRKQARLVLQPHSNMHETLEGYRRYFNHIVGFFVVEDHVLHTTHGLVNRAYVEELWELALSKITAALRTHSSYCDDPDLVLDLKNLIVIFADTLQGYGFPVSQLFDMLLEMREQYSEILLKRWNITFRFLNYDNFSPIPVSTEEEFRHYTALFPLHDPELDKMPFPKKLPFSEFVPKVYCQLKEFIYACLKYSEDLHLSSTEVDDMIRKSTNLLLTRTLSHCLHYGIKKKNVGLAELVQVIINSTHLEHSCGFLEEFISNITNVPLDTVSATRLYGPSTFKDASHAAEAEIYASLNAKIDQFLQLADYDWMAPAPGGGASEVSDYLIDLIAFLRSTFSVFTNLPGKVAQTACMSACKHISTSLLQLLLDPELRQVSLGGLHQLHTDVQECESFARAGPVAGFQGDTLLLAFSDLRQLLDLFTQWDWSTYLADYGKPSCKYLRVNPHTALTLLEKMRETGKKNMILAQLRKTDRDRQKLIDTVIKQLRNLISQQ